MTVQECYRQMGGDYLAVLKRFGNEGLMERFLFKMPEDKSYSQLRSALMNGNAQEAFRAAHTLKGVCMNLGIGTLCDVVSVLTEALRDLEITEEVLSLADMVEKEYMADMQRIQELMES